MPIPDYETTMLPLLTFARDGAEHSLRDAINGLAGHFRLSESDRQTLLPSGRQPVFDNRIGWSRTYLVKAGLLKSTRRGYFQITDAGRGVLAHHLTQIDGAYLERFPTFMEFKALRRRPVPSDDADGDSRRDATTPEEALEKSYQILRDQLADDLLAQIARSSSASFERIVVKLLVAMGYGGSWREAAEVIGKSGDEGIDGIIKSLSEKS